MLPLDDCFSALEGTILGLMRSACIVVFKALVLPGCQMLMETATLEEIQTLPDRLHSYGCSTCVDSLSRFPHDNALAQL